MQLLTLNANLIVLDLILAGYAQVIHQFAIYHKFVQMEKSLLPKNNVMTAINLKGMAALLFALLKQITSVKESHLFALLVEISS